MAPHGRRPTFTPKWSVELVKAKKPGEVKATVEVTSKDAGKKKVKVKLPDPKTGLA